MNSYTVKISNIEAEKVKDFLSSKGAVFDSVQYSLWRAKMNDFQAIYYSSGKLLLQGKNISDSVILINELLGIKEEKIKDNNIEVPSKYIGTDESGKGDFFGPLVCAGVEVDASNRQKFIDLGIKDSKKLDDKKILELASKIKANAVHSVVVITPVKYNELYKKFNNLNKLLAWAHARAIENILEKSPCNFALADKFGDESLILNSLMEKGRKIELKQMVRAESDIAVASASVLARAEFVKRMKELENKYEMQLSKGASSSVLEEAKLFVSRYSYERLNEVAKMHFKTVLQIRK